jgi:two-component system, response regulator
MDKQMIEKSIILLIDDNLDDINLTIRALRKHKIEHNLIVMADGVQAVEYLLGIASGLQSSAIPKVILLDLKMPKIDGFQILRRIRSNPRTSMLPVVIFTTSNEERDMIESYQCGASSFVRKPIDFSAFSEAIRQICVYWLSVNQVPVLRNE